MSIAVYIFVRFIYYLLGAVNIMLLLRAVLSWIMPDLNGGFIDFLYNVTEPFIYPVRLLLGKLKFVREFPLDLAFFATCILISIIQQVIIFFIG